MSTFKYAAKAPGGTTVEGVSSVVLLRWGMSAQTGMFFVMAIAGMVCTALSVSGQTVTDRPLVTGR